MSGGSAGGGGCGSGNRDRHGLRLVAVMSVVVDHGSGGLDCEEWLSCLLLVFAAVVVLLLSSASLLSALVTAVSGVLWRTGVDNDGSTGV